MVPLEADFCKSLLCGPVYNCYLFLWPFVCIRLQAYPLWNISHKEIYNVLPLLNIFIVCRCVIL